MSRVAKSEGAKPRSSAKIVFVSAPKGGVGKTTIVRNLLVAGSMAGFKVLGLDCDPQRTLGKWHSRRPKEASALDVLSIHIAQWETEVDRFLNAYDLIVIDPSPAVENNIVNVNDITMRADLTIVPTGHTEDDLDSVLPWLTELNRSKIVVAALLNRVNRRESSFDEALGRLNRIGKVCPIEVPNYADIHQFSRHGLTPLDIGRAKGTDKLQNVWEFVRREIAL